MSLANMTGSVLAMTPHQFDWLDHTVFALMLGVSLLVGVYYGVCGREHNVAKEDYLQGGRKMGILPIAISQVASYTSGTKLVGVPSEIYLYGSIYSITFISAILTSVAVYYIYLPVFFGLQITSVYEYLERRYNRVIRLLASGCYLFNLVLHMPLFVYVPALAFNQVSGINIHITTSVVSVICIIYTMMGGLKAVVWTDVLQSVVALAAYISVIGIGLYVVGGPINVWKIAEEGGRLSFFDMTPSPFVRSSFWTVTFGVTASWLAGRAISQDMVQRYIALPDLKSARKSLYGFTIGIIITTVISVVTGLLIYSIYHDCDPIKSKTISRPDQLLPYYVMQAASGVPALPGLFIAGVFSAALSTMSSCMNALAGTVYEDFVLPLMPPRPSDRTVNLVMQAIVLTVGAISCALVLVVEKLGTVLELAFSLSGTFDSTLLGIYTLGMLCPWANSKGAAAGAVSGMVLIAVTVVGAQHAFATGRLHYPRLPTSVAGCADNVTEAIAATTTIRPNVTVAAAAAPSAPLLFQLSYQYYVLLGTLVVLTVGAAVSYLTGGTQGRGVDPALLAPQVRRFAAKKSAPPDTDPAVVVELLAKKPADTHDSNNLLRAGQ